MRERHQEKRNEKLDTKAQPKQADEAYAPADQGFEPELEKELDYPEEPAPINFQFSRKVKQAMVGIVAVCAAAAVGIWALTLPVGDVPPSDTEQKTYEDNYELFLAETEESLARWKSTALPLLGADAEPSEVATALEERIAQGEFQPDHGDEEQTSQLVEDVRSGAMEVREMSFFDSEAEDGDVLQIEINGAVFTVPIWHEPTSVLFPFNPSGPNQMKITGVVDGGGGVTLGVIAQGQRIPLPYILTGQHLTLNVK